MHNPKKNFIIILCKNYECLALEAQRVQGMKQIAEYEQKIKDLEAEIAVMRERYRILAETTHSLLFEYQPSEDTMVYYYNFPDNHTTRKIPNYREYIRENIVIHQSHLKNVLKVLHRASKTPLKGEVDYLSKISGGSYEWHKSYYASITDEAGKVVAVVGKIQNIHKFVTEQHELTRRMETDSLTGLFNREAASDKMQDWLDLNPTAEAYMIIAVIDNVDDINKTYGHAVGDDILKQTSRVLRQHFQDMGVPARYSGAEFIVFIMDESIEIVEPRVDSFLDVLTNTVRAYDKPVRCSVGIAGRVDKYDKFEDLFNRADHAMYLARQSGKNSYYIYRK